MAGCEESFGFYFIFVLLTYLLWMDLSFFDELAVYGSNYNSTIASKMMFPVKSVKLRMTEHIDHYINLPLMELSEEKLGISSIPGITPNVISGFHFFCAVVACKFFVSEHLAFRRIGCAIYEFRNQLDLLDGVVYRAQAHKKIFVSGWGSSGYLVDAAMDFGGGLLMAFSLGVFLHRFPPLKKVRVRKDVEAGVGLLTEHYPTKPEKTTYSFVHVDRRTITTTVLLAVVQVIGRSGFWDHFVRSYHELLELPNPHYPKELQAEVLNYRSTWLVMWLWKISSADAFFQFTLLAMLFDKSWVWLKMVFYIGWFQIAGVIALSQLHLMESIVPYLQWQDCFQTNFHKNLKHVQMFFPCVPCFTVIYFYIIRIKKCSVCSSKMYKKAINHNAQS